ncbi:MAG: hypothetical protein QM731_05090 [Chitinophagaceae bacterium]
MPPIVYEQYGPNWSLGEEEFFTGQDSVSPQKPPRNRTPIIIVLTLASFFVSFYLYGFFNREEEPNTNDQTVTIHVQKVHLRQVMKFIEAQTSYRFCFTDEQMAIAKPVSVDVSDERVLRVLQTCFKDQPFRYVLMDTIVVVQTVRRR